MTKTRRVVLLCIISLITLSVASGAVFTLRTIALYNGVCDDLTGFPGLLQSAGFVAKGHCALVNNKCPVNHACVVNGHRGNCVVETINNKPQCICRPKHISQP